MTSTTATQPIVDLDYVHPPIVVPVVPRLRLENVRNMEKTQLTAVLDRLGLAYKSVTKVHKYTWAKIAFVNDEDRAVAREKLEAEPEFSDIKIIDKDLQTNDDDRSQPPAKRQKKAKSGKKAPKTIADVLQPWHNKSLEEQLQLKTKHLRNVLREMGDATRKSNSDVPLWLSRRMQAPVCAMEPIRATVPNNATPYRNKFTFRIGLDEQGNIAVASIFRGQASGESVLIRPNTPDCGVSQPIANAREAAEKMVKEIGGDAFDMAEHVGFWRTLLVRALSTNKIIAMISVSRATLTEREVRRRVQAMRDWSDANSAPWTSLFVQFDEGISNAAAADAPVELVCGEVDACEELLGLKFRISPLSFFQVNHEGAVQCYSIVRDMVQTIVGDNGEQAAVLDVCCGTGTIGLLLSSLGLLCSTFTNVTLTVQAVKRVVGIEMIEEAVEDAKANAALNAIENVEFVAGKVEHVLNAEKLNEMIGDAKQVIAVLDPPREGVHNTVLRTLRACKRITHIVYVSCNQSSLINDSPLLMGKVTRKSAGLPFYAENSVGVDMFPNTDHVEFIVQFNRCGTDVEEQARLNRLDEAAAAERRARQEARDALRAAAMSENK